MKMSVINEIFYELLIRLVSVQHHLSYSLFEFSQCTAEREESTTAGEKQHGC